MEPLEQIENPRQRTIEIRHFDRQDIIINKTYPDQEEVEKLVMQVKDGIPPTWTRYLPEGEEEEENLMNLYIDSETNPHYLAKIRKYADAVRFRSRRDATDPGTDRRGLVIGFNSVVNEIRLAPQIATIAASAEGQKIAEKYGFKSFSFIPPLLSTIERAAGKKVLYYPWQEGVTSLSPFELVADGENPLKQLLYSGKYKEFEADFANFFRANKIEPRDFGIMQFIVHKDDLGSHLYLIDIEGFGKSTQIS